MKKTFSAGKVNTLVVVLVFVCISLLFKYLIVPQYVRHFYKPDIADGSTWHDSELGITVSYPMLLFPSPGKTNELDFFGSAGTVPIIRIVKATVAPAGMPSQASEQTKAGRPIYVISSQTGNSTYVIPWSSGSFIVVSGLADVALPMAKDLR